MKLSEAFEEKRPRDHVGLLNMKKWKSSQLRRGRHLGLATLAVFNERCVWLCVQNDVKNTHFTAGVRIFLRSLDFLGGPTNLKWCV